MSTAFRHTKDTLPNGLRFVTVELPHLHSATVVVYSKVGSRYESEADNGLSHFLEHMLFRGTSRYPSSYELNFAIEELGGTLYAETGRDYSMYQIGLHPDLVEHGISLMGEIFHAPAFEQIELERRIVMEEILEDFDEKGRLINLDDIARRVVFDDHALGQPIIGPVANVERFDVADCRRHFARFYGARNLVVCVSGPVERARVLEWVARSFGGLPEGSEAISPPPGAASGRPKYTHTQHTSSQTAVQVLFRALAEDHPDYAVQQAISRVLDDGMSTRLHYQLCDQKGLAYHVSGGLEAYHDCALFVVDGASAHAKLPTLLREIFRLVDEFKQAEVSPAELAKAKRRYRFDLDGAFDDPDALAGWFGGTELFYPPLSYEAKLTRTNGVSPADIQRVAREIFRPERLVVGSVGVLSAKLEREVREIVEGYPA